MMPVSARRRWVQASGVRRPRSINNQTLASGETWVSPQPFTAGYATSTTTLPGLRASGAPPLQPSLRFAASIVAAAHQRV